MEYRESADPSYPELKADTYQDVFHALGIHGKKLKIGVASYLDTSVVIMDGIRSAFPEAEIVRADHIMVELRSIKTENELNCLREGYRISELAMQQVIKEIRPGMTELEMVGVAQRVIYEMVRSMKVCQCMFFQKHQHVMQSQDHHIGNSRKEILCSLISLPGLMDTRHLLDILLFWGSLREEEER